MLNTKSFSNLDYSLVLLDIRHKYTDISTVYLVLYCLFVFVFIFILISGLGDHYQPVFELLTVQKNPVLRTAHVCNSFNLMLNFI